MSHTRLNVGACLIGAELRWLRRAAVTAVAVATIGLLGGCAGDGGSTRASTPSANGPSTGSQAPVDRSDPGRVAVAFIQRMTRGDYPGAKEVLDPDKYGVLDALAMGASGAPGTTASGTLTAGRVRVAGDAGTVTLVGRLCRDIGTESASPDCIENSDVNSTQPVFTVHVKRIEGRWFATFPTPSVTGTTQTH